MAKNGKSGYKIPVNIAWRRVDEEIVILNLESSQYYSLNSVAGRIWELISEGKDEEGIVKSLVAEYKVEEKAARADLKSFVEQLKEERAIAKK